MKENIAKKSRPRVLLALDYYDYRIHRGVARVAAQKGWSLMCTQSSVGVPSVPEGWNGQGVISLMSYQNTIAALTSLNIPIVDIGLYPLAFAVSRIVTDNVAIGTLAAEHLLHKGLRSFLVIEVQNPQRMFGERQASYIETLKKFPKKISLNFIPEQSDRSQWEEALQKCPKPLGIFGYVDGLALNIMDMALEFGYAVPEDIALLGVDNNDLACEGVDVPLSSVESDQDGLGEKAAHLLARRMEGEAGSTEILRHRPLGVTIRKSTDTLASNQPKVSKALHLIQSEYASGINAMDLARRLKMTPQGLQQLFKEHDGRSPGQILRMVKIERAKEMLVQPEHKLKTVALDCGFGSLEAFCRAFKNSVGITPTQWRRVLE